MNSIIEASFIRAPSTCLTGKKPWLSNLPQVARYIGALLASALMVSSGSALAQSPQPSDANPAAAQMCPPPLPEAAAFLDLTTNIMVTPGVKFSLNDITPELMQLAALIQKDAAERQARDWPNLCKYAADNAALIASGKRPRTIFIGDSITENWIRADPAIFNSEVLDRGIGGQTTPQMVLRMFPDVIALRPRLVHIMAGVNDITGNTGPVTDNTIIDNIRAMIILAKANNIKVLLGSIMPSSGFIFKPGPNPSARIIRVNGLLRKLAAEQDVTFLDYHAALTDPEGGMQPGLANDGLHPNRDGYAIIKPILERAISKLGER
jgi:lysophospholipase L1-like esterase